MLCIAAAFAANLALQAADALIFGPTGISRALTLGLASGNRNMGLVLADKADFDVVVFSPSVSCRCTSCRRCCGRPTGG